MQRCDEQESRERELIHEITSLEKHSQMLTRLNQGLQEEIDQQMHNDSVVRQQMEMSRKHLDTLQQRHAEAA